MKSFYNRSPLTVNTRSNLELGKIKPQGWLKDFIAARTKDILHAYDILKAAEGETESAADHALKALTALLLLSQVLDEKTLKDKAKQGIDEILGSQRDDGGFEFKGAADHLTCMRALNAVYLFFTATGDKKALVFIDRYLKYEFKTLSDDPLKGKACAQAADNLYIALKLYNITGQKYLIELCKRLKSQMLDWTNIFSTFPNVQPMSKSMSLRRLREGMAGEKNDLKGEDHPFFASYYHQSLGENVANALKAPGTVSLFKSGFKELNGFKYGWEKLMKYHGTALGMFTCDEHLNGTNPSAGIGTRAVCEATRSIETLIDCGNFGDELPDILEKLCFNALPAVLKPTDGACQSLQQTNQLNLSIEGHAWYNAADDANVLKKDASCDDCLDVICAMSAFAAGLWQASADDGLSAVSYAPCIVNHMIDSIPVKLSVETDYPFTDSVKISVETKQAVEFPLYLRIPYWAENPMIHLPNGEIMSVRAGETACLRQRWTSDSEIKLVLPRSCRVSRWSRQSAAVELGPLLMALELKGRSIEHKKDGSVYCERRLDGDWAYALAAGEGLKLIEPEGGKIGFMPGQTLPGVLARLVKTELWKKEGQDAGTFPILPPTAKNELVTFKLVPYGATKLRIGQFPIIKLEEENA